MVCRKKALLATVAGVLLAPGPASAQFYFRPFFQPFAYSYSDNYPEHNEAPARYGSRRAVASILARAGFRLVGSLGRRGEQIVATGYSRRDGDMRFLVDPYEGRIIRGARVGPPDDETGPRRDEPTEYLQPPGGVRPVVRDLVDGTAHAERRRRHDAEGPRHAPEREWVTLEGQKERPAPRRITPAAPTGSADSAAPVNRPEPKPIDAKTPTPEPPQARREPPASKPARSAPSEDAPAKPRANTTIVAKPASAAYTGNARPPHTASNAGGSSHRAIVPPTTVPSAATNMAN